MTLGLTVAVAVGLSLLVRGLVAAFAFEFEPALVAPPLYLVGLGVYLAAIAGVYLFAARRAGWAALGLVWPPWTSMALVLPLLLLELLALAAVNGLLVMLLGSFENPQVEAISGGRTLTPRELWLLLLLVAGVVPFAEELVFRGMLYPLLRARMLPIFAIILNAAIFAAAHFILVLLPGLFVVGLILAYLREQSGSIWPGVLLHALQNSLALLAITAALG